MTHNNLQALGYVMTLLHTELNSWPYCASSARSCPAVELEPTLLVWGVSPNSSVRAMLKVLYNISILGETTYNKEDVCYVATGADVKIALLSFAKNMHKLYTQL